MPKPRIQARAVDADTLEVHLYDYLSPYADEWGGISSKQVLHALAVKPDAKTIRLRITWMALRGDEPLVIQQRAGHEDFATTQRYLREAETLGRDSGVPFPPLPDDLISSRFSSQAVQVLEFMERDTGLEPATPSLGSSCSTN